MISSGFFDAKNSDRVYNAEQMSSIFDGLIEDGVYKAYLDALKVVPNSGMSVSVLPGRAWFDHTWTYNDSPLILSVDQAASSTDRIDYVVLDVDSREDYRKNSIIIVKGGTSQQPPTLIHEDGHNQYPLASINVTRGASSISSSNITDLRGKPDCPYVNTIVESDNLNVMTNDEIDEAFYI